MDICISKSSSSDLKIDYNPSTSSESSRSVDYTDPSKSFALDKNSSALDTLASTAIQMSQESEDDGFWSNNAFINEASNMELQIPRKRKQTMLHSCKYQHPIIPLVGIHWILPRIRTIDHRHFNQEQLAEAHLNTRPVVLKLHFLLLLLRYLYQKDSEIRDRKVEN